MVARQSLLAGLKIKLSIKMVNGLDGCINCSVHNHLMPIRLHCTANQGTQYTVIQQELWPPTSNNIFENTTENQSNSAFISYL